MASEDLLYLGVAELAERVRTRALSPVELTEAYLARIEALDARLHAFVTVMADEARREAAAAAKEIAAGTYRGPLHGIPYAAKDLLATRGAPTTWGAAPFRRQAFDYDAAVVEKLREAGAILLGKLAMIELAGGLGYTTPDASLTGAARNPWDTSRWTCGSSSGSGAAVAAGLVAFAIGSETWGSIVCPSSFCGVSGLRPTFGRVSRHGAMTLAWTFDKLAPMARGADDCATVLRAIEGHDPRDDWSAADAPRTSTATPDVGSLRVGYVRFDAAGGEPEVGAAYARALADLERAGVKPREVELPDLPFEAVAAVTIAAEAASAFEELFRDGRVRQLAAPEAPLAALQARAIGAADLVKAARIRAVCQKRMARFFGEWDLLVAPGEPMTAFPADRSFAEVSWSDPVGAMGNLCGLPAVAVPCGFGRGRLPASLSITAAAFDDEKALALAREYQRVTQWHRERPPIA